MRLPRTASAIVLFAWLSGASIASAQTPASGPVQSGPLVLTPIPTAIVFSPEAKVTTVNDKTAVLAGAYLAKLIEHSVLVGGGAYWLADDRDDARLWYAGLVLGWRVYGTDRFNVSARSLFGIGQGTAFDPVTIVGLPRSHPYLPGGEFRVGYRDNFLVADPEVEFLMAITDALSLNVGAGYRATTAARGLNEAFRGPTGSIGLQFNIGK